MVSLSLSVRNRFWVWGLRFRVWGLGMRVKGLRVHALGLWVTVLGRPKEGRWAFPKTGIFADRKGSAACKALIEDKATWVHFVNFPDRSLFSLGMCQNTPHYGCSCCGCSTFIYRCYCRHHYCYCLMICTNDYLGHHSCSHYLL